VAKVKNVSTQGDLELPMLGRIVKAGEVFEVPADVAELLVVQSNVWAAVNVKEVRNANPA
jgi:hypothetical protein